MSVRHVSVQDARRMLETEGYTYVDVRSIPEYEQGHPAGAVNVPLLHVEARTRQMVPNPEFLAVMQANFPHGVRLLIGCQAGPRSARAAQLLEAAGYETVCNVLGGFGGMRNAFGRIVDQGWVDAGLPVETAAPSGGSYEDLRQKTK